jgi:hypothetical protein
MEMNDIIPEETTTPAGFEGIPADTEASVDHETCTDCTDPIHDDCEDESIDNDTCDCPEGVANHVDDCRYHKTVQQLAMEEMERQNTARMEKIVITAREKLLPFLKSKNRSVNESTRVMQSMAVTIQQGLFELMKTNNVSVLNLRDKVNEKYPDYEQFIELIDLMEPETLEYAIESLQWMGSKIEAVITAENKVRTFEELNLDF